MAFSCIVLGGVAAGMHIAHVRACLLMGRGLVLRMILLRHQRREWERVRDVVVGRRQVGMRGRSRELLFGSMLVIHV